MQASGLYLQSKCLPSLRAVLTLLEVVLRSGRITDLVIVLSKDGYLWLCALVQAEKHDFQIYAQNASFYWG